MDIERGQLWDMYSARENRWMPVVVVKVEEESVTLRPKGFIEFFTVPRADMATRIVPANKGALVVSRPDNQIGPLLFR